MIKIAAPSVAPPIPTAKYKLLASTTLEDLVNECVRITAIPQGCLQLLYGFPPKPLDPSSSKSALVMECLGIKPGDTVLCAENLPCTLLPTDLRWDDPIESSDLPITRHVIDADNSCLFNAIVFAVNGASGYPSAASLRSAIARLVQGCSPALLGKTPQEYAEWIVSPEAWGGEIEMSLIAKSLLRGLGLRAVDVSTGVVYSYDGDSDGEGEGEGEGEGKVFVSRVAYLLYDGIHYDLLVRGHQRVFAPDDERALREAQAVAAEAKRLRAFTDTSSFTLRCLVCQQGLVGQREAQNHAKSTGHTNFSEY